MEDASPPVTRPSTRHALAADGIGSVSLNYGEVRTDSLLAAGYARSGSVVLVAEEFDETAPALSPDGRFPRGVVERLILVENFFEELKAKVGN